VDRVLIGMLNGTDEPWRSASILSDNGWLVQPASWVDADIGYWRHGIVDVGVKLTAW